MNKYLYIIKNSYRESNQSKYLLLFSLIDPVLQTIALIFFYSYITRSRTNFISNEVLIYFIFILVVSSVDLRRFASRIEKDISDETYLNIDKLPINPFLYYFLKSLGKNIIVLLLLIIVGIISMAYLKVPLLGLILFTPSIIMAVLISHLIYFNIALLRFYTRHIRIWFFGIIFDFLSGRLVPLNFMPSILQTIFLVFLPFVYASGALAKYFSQFNFNQLLVSLSISFIWLFLLSVSSNKLWTNGGYRFQENG